MECDTELIRRAITEIVREYSLSPDIARELLQSILDILHNYSNEENSNKGDKLK